MKHILTALVTTILVTSPVSYAQDSQSFFNLSLDYLYGNINYTEPGVMKESGQFPGIRGQLRLNLLSNVQLSAGGSYFDGHLFYEGATFGGTPVTQTTVDYFRDIRYLVHLKFDSVEFSSGVAERYWLNDLVISYKRRTEYKYIPIIIKYNAMPFYTQLEYRSWVEGTNVSTMSRVNPASRDVTFTQDKGGGYAIELGVEYPFGALKAKSFLVYDVWSVADSDIQNDNTQNLIEPKNNTKTYILGVGFTY